MELFLNVIDFFFEQCNNITSNVVRKKKLIVFLAFCFVSCTNHQMPSVDFDSMFENDMMMVEGGWFEMGCLNDDWLDGSYCYTEDCPEHLVYVSDFMIGKYEVTLEQWKLVMGEYPKYFNEKFLQNKSHDYKQLPVYYVTWYECQRFISELNKKSERKYRMPTEAEWEYSAQGGNRTHRFAFSGSDSVSDVAVLGRRPNPIGTLRPNELGLYDMSGNVMEWCSDWYGDYSSDKQINPTGETDGLFRVVRGGSFSSDILFCAIKKRNSYNPDYRGEIGLRLVTGLHN